MAEVKKGGLSRRDFIKGTGLAVGGAAIGSSLLAVACKPAAEPVVTPGADVIVNKFVCPYDNQEFPSLTALQDHVKTAHAAAPPPAAGYVCPYDNQNFTTMAALQAHMASAHPAPAVPPPAAVTYPCPYDTQVFTTLAALKTHLDTVHGGATAATPGTPATPVTETTKFTLNGNPVAVVVKDWWTLNYVIRNVLGMTGGTKISCDEGICGMCTVQIGDKPQLSCMTLAVECAGKDILTVEGLEDPKTGRLDPVQQGFMNEMGFQCGYCTTGHIMAAHAFLGKNKNPTRDEVRLALSNNLCLCGNYESMQLSVLTAAKLMSGG